MTHLGFGSVFAADKYFTCSGPRTQWRGCSFKNSPSSCHRNKQFGQDSALTTPPPPPPLELLSHSLLVNISVATKLDSDITESLRNNSQPCIKDPLMWEQRFWSGRRALRHQEIARCPHKSTCLSSGRRPQTFNAPSTLIKINIFLQ